MAATPTLEALLAEWIVAFNAHDLDRHMKLYTEEKISLENALKYSSNPTEFELRVKGIHATSDESWKTFERPKQEFV